MTLGVLYNPWTGQATRDWIMEQIAGGNGDGLEELEAELAAEADASSSRRQRLRAVSRPGFASRLSAFSSAPGTRPLVDAMSSASSRTAPGGGSVALPGPVGT